MYTVLIQSKGTAEEFQQFYPLISNSIEAGRLGICQWIESGTTIETALPDLYDLIDHKSIWRALIVCVAPEDDKKEYPTNPFNPYDFLVNRDRTGLTVEGGKLTDSEVPLIRLTHLLGGIPAPEPQFVSVVETKPNMVPQIKYQVVAEEDHKQLEEVHKEWSETHSLRASLPTEIILVKVRKDIYNDSNDSVGLAWNTYTESESSKFWQRNTYPHSCRFLFCDFENRGTMRRQRDLFKLWTALTILVDNKIDPNVLQSHRLYKLDVSFDNRVLQMVFQDTIAKLNRAQYGLKKKQKKEQLLETNIYDEIPDYEVRVPVSFQLPKISGMHFDAEQYPLAPKGIQTELSCWNDYSIKAVDEMEKLINSVERVLDQTAGRMRMQYRYSSTEVAPISQYQEEDMEASLSKVYQDVLDDQVQLPVELSDLQDGIRQSGDDVRGLLLRRINKKQVLILLAVPCFLLLLCYLPGLLGGSSLAILLGASVVSIAAIIISGVSTLAAQRRKVKKSVKKYQMFLQSVVSEMSHNATKYSSFFTDVATHIHGKSYLNVIEGRRRKRENAYFYRMKHLKSIEMFLAKLSLWSSAFHVDVDMDSVGTDELLQEEIDDAIEYDRLYMFEQERGYKIPLNQTGEFIMSPFKFVTGVQIEREEIYDNVEYS